MDTQKVELRALLDDQLDAVSGGANNENELKAQENKKQMEWVKLAQQLLAAG